MRTPGNTPPAPPVPLLALPKVALLLVPLLAPRPKGPLRLATRSEALPPWDAMPPPPTPPAPPKPAELPLGEAPGDVRAPGMRNPGWSEPLDESETPAPGAIWLEALSSPP